MPLTYIRTLAAVIVKKFKKPFSLLTLLSEKDVFLKLIYLCGWGFILDDIELEGKYLEFRGAWLFVITTQLQWYCSENDW